jgi:hypothetical protein
MRRCSFVLQINRTPFIQRFIFKNVGNFLLQKPSVHPSCSTTSEDENDQSADNVDLLTAHWYWNVAERYLIQRREKSELYVMDTVVTELWFSKPYNEANGDYHSASCRSPTGKQRPGLRCIHLTCGLHAVFSMLLCGEHDISRFFAYCHRTALHHLNVLINVTLSCNTNVGKYTFILQRR